MSRYTNETPMDFEFQNGTGPLDVRSPFAQVSANPQRHPPSTSSPSKKRAHGVFDSPSKPRAMGVRPSSPQKPLPPTPAAYNNLFSTPRKPKNEIDDSSAGETPKSVEPKTDSDATPENTNRTRTLITLDHDGVAATGGARRERGSPTKERPNAQRRDSLLFQLAAKVKNKVYSPGRGEVPRKDHSGAIEKSVARRRKREVDQRVARKRRLSASDSADDPDQPPHSPRKNGNNGQEGEGKKPYWISSLFTFIAQHPTLPNTLSQYAQFVFNIFWLSVLAYAMYCFWSAVMGDVDKMANEARAGILGAIKGCRADYEANGCGGPHRPPAIAPMCEEWHRCMTQDSTLVARAKISAHTFAQIFNSFVEPISYKAMIFTCILVFGCFASSNLAFGFFRHKMQESTPGYGYPYAPPPPTPQRTFSGQENNFYASTPWHQPPPGAAFEPQPSAGFGQIEGRDSPQRRLLYN